MSRIGEFFLYFLLAVFFVLTCFSGLENYPY